MTFEFTETFDIEIAKKLLSLDWEQCLPKKERNISLETYKKLLNLRIQLSSNNELKVKYHKKDCGRYYSNDRLSVFENPRIIKETLLHKYYYDIDIVNAQPTLLLQYCNKNGIKTRFLNLYIQDREEIISEVMEAYKVDRQTVKDLFISLTNGSTVKSWIEKFVSPDIKTYTAFPIGYESDIKKIYTELNIKNDENGRSEFNKILSNLESQCLETMLNYCKTYTDKLIPCHDGFCISKEVEITNDLDKLIKILEEEIFTKLGYTIKLKVKSMDDYIKLDDIEVDVDEEIDIVEPADGSNYDTFKEYFENKKGLCKVLSTSSYFILEDNTYVSKIEKEIIQNYKQLKFPKVTVNEKTKKEKTNYVSFIKDWVEDGKMKVYEKVDTFPNPKKCPNKCLNLWTPFNAERIKLRKFKQDSVDFFLNHLLILCNREKEIYEHVIKWVAHMLQYPEQKSIMPVFISKQGAGKGSFKNLLDKLIGSSKIMETTQPDRDVWGSFNMPMVSSYFVIINETSKKETSGYMGRIKGLITDKELWINPKGTNQYRINSYHRFLYTTNYEDPIETTEDDRRTLIIRCSDELIDKEKNKEYFDKYYSLLEDNDSIRSLFDYFMSLEVKDFINLKIPITEYQKTLQELSKNPIELWLTDLIHKNTKLDNITMTSEEMYQSFNTWKIKNGFEKYEINSLKLGVRLKNSYGDYITSIKGRKANSKVLDLNKLKTLFNLDCLIDDEDDVKDDIELPEKTI
jgi:hypothetical protein